MMEPTDLHLEEVTASDTHPLRRAVLRDGDPTRSVVFDRDDDPDTLHLGIRDTRGELIAISSWIPNRLGDFPDDRSIQLRGMATAAAVRGTGVGSLLFEAGLDRAAVRGFTLMWARARDSAIGFYDRHGCAVVGEGFVDEVTRLPHHVVIRRLAP